MEPKRLSKGKHFHKLVQDHWRKTNQGGKFLREKVLRTDQDIHSLSPKRMDILITEMDGLVAIIEIKNTYWDRIFPKNINRNLYRHQKQIWDYIEEYVNSNIDVCPGIIYPQRPNKELTKYIEEYHDERGIVVVWFEDKEKL